MYIICINLIFIIIINKQREIDGKKTGKFSRVKRRQEFPACGRRQGTWRQNVFCRKWENPEATLDITIKTTKQPLRANGVLSSSGKRVAACFCQPGKEGGFCFSLLLLIIFFRFFFSFFASFLMSSHLCVGFGFCRISMGGVCIYQAWGGIETRGIPWI